MPTHEADDAPSPDLTLTLNVWVLPWWATAAIVAIVFLGAGAFRFLWIGLAVVGSLSFVVLGRTRLRVMVRGRVLYVTGWSSALGSYMSAGVDLTHLKSVELISPFFFWQTLVVVDQAGERAGIQRIFFRRFRQLVELVARLALSPGASVEMSAETERRLVRVAT